MFRDLLRVRLHGRKVQPVWRGSLLNMRRWEVYYYIGAQSKLYELHRHHLRGRLRTLCGDDHQ